MQDTLQKIDRLENIVADQNTQMKLMEKTINDVVELQKESKEIHKDIADSLSTLNVQYIRTEAIVTEVKMLIDRQKELEDRQTKVEKKIIDIKTWVTGVGVGVTVVLTAIKLFVQK